MARLKTILDSEAVRNAAARAIAAYLRLAGRLGGWRIEGGDVPDRLVADSAPFIACFWHGRMAMIRHAWRYDAPMRILISHHRDGRLIAAALRRLGVGTISGSTSRGGVGALRAVIRHLADGGYVGITPDGPRGPRMRAQLGAVQAARLSGAPLLPVSCAPRWAVSFKSWDRFLLPYPFGGGTIAVGEPIVVARDADAAEMEAARLLLERRLNDLTRRLDARYGRITPEPGRDLSEPTGAQPQPAAQTEGRS